MRMAHILPVYKDPAQVERLIRKMSHPSFDFYVHVDAKFDIAPFRYLEKIERVYLISNRMKVRWAGFSYTRSVLNCIEEIFATNRQYDFINCMSGQDYPLVNTQAFYEFFEKQPGKSFLAIEEFGSPWWKQAEIRIHRYHMTDFDFRGRYLIQSMLNKLLPKREFPIKGFTLFGGNRATWWTISADCAAYVVKFMREHPELTRFAKFTWAPDEYLIPTIIMNSPFAEKVVHENYRYIDWSQGGSNPKILTVDDYDAITKSGKLLARKFDIQKDTRILDLLDEVTA